MTPKKSTNCKGKPLGSGTTNAKRREEFKEKGKNSELQNMAIEDGLAAKIDWSLDKQSANNKRAKQLSEAEVKAFFPTEEERKKKKKKEEEEKKKQEAEKAPTLDKKVDAASVSTTEAAGSVDKTLPSSEQATAAQASEQATAAQGSVDKTFPSSSTGVKEEKLRPALAAWEEVKRRMELKNKKARRGSRRGKPERPQELNPLQTGT